jgi:CheY-like chemotaxis protein
VAGEKETPRRVTVVDDDGVCLAMMSRSLRKRGFHVCAYGDPRVALDRLALDLPQAVITDMRMPHMSGLEVVREVRSRLGDQAPPILVVSSDDEEQALEDAFRLGADDYLLKPINEVELAVKLEKALRPTSTEVQTPGAVLPTIPEMIGSWTLLDCIGRGGTACVFTAVKQGTSERCALKVVWPHLTGSTETLLRFRREIDTLSHLEHPRLVRFLESGRHEDFYYYVMSYVPGGTLRARIRKRGPQTPSEALRVVHEVCDPLGYLHGEDLAHRDVKPGNIFFDAHDEVILGDFGLAKRLLDKGITLSEEFVGTPLYLAPEVFRSDQFDHTVDLYALGVCAYEMLLGRPPLEESDSMRLIGRIMNEGLPRLSQAIPDLPTPALDVLERLLASSPADRFQTAAEVQAAAEAARAEL